MTIRNRFWLKSLCKYEGPSKFCVPNIRKLVRYQIKVANKNKIFKMNQEKSN